MANNIHKTKKLPATKSIAGSPEAKKDSFDLNKLLTERVKAFRKGKEKSLTWDEVEQLAKKEYEQR